EQVTVPDVVGLTLQEARFQLLSKGLTIGAVQYDEPDNGQNKAVVYRQTPAAGRRLIEGETVALHLSNDPDKVKTGSQKDEEDEWF
ncbi:PASTA domain-containing protein, partial [Klebsiella pneumoniae]|nr:PASTA domain-containing protein [Klebsiella pneumoniae]